MSTIVCTTGKERNAIRIAAGLRWVILNGGLGKGKPQRSQIRAQAGAVSASKYVLLDVDKTRTIGLFNDPPAKPGKGKIYALSTLFLSGLVRNGSDPLGINAILLMEPVGLPEQRVLVSIEGGQVVHDIVLDHQRALKQVKDLIEQSPHATLFLQHPEIDRGHNLLSWDDLIALADKQAADSILKDVPISPYLVPSVLMILILASCYLAYDEYVIQPEKKRLAAVAAAKRDHTPQYLAAADQALRTRGWDIADLTAFTSDLNSRPMLVKGWTRDVMNCNLVSCTTQWGRHGGLFSELMDSLRDEKPILTPQDGARLAQDSNSAALMSSVEKTVTLHEYERKRANVARADLKPIREVISTLRPVFQQLGNASVSVNAPEPRIWKVADTAGVRQNELLIEQPVQVVMPLFRLPEVLSMLPAYVLINSMQITIADGNVNVNISGSAYARQ